MVDFQERDTRRGIGDATDRGDERDGRDRESSRGVHHGSADHSRTNRNHDEGEGDDDAQERDHPDGGDHHDAHDHGHHAHDVGTLGAGVVTVSSSRSLDADPSGDAIVDAFEEADHGVVTRELVPDDYDRVQDVVGSVASRRDVDVVVTTGGTGVTPDDVTIEAVEPLFEKELPGFGELFRRRSEADVGTRVVATRATAGIADGVPVFCLPGSEAAVRLGVAEIILPEAGHLAGLARRDEDEE